jgi:hypothetical protein
MKKTRTFIITSAVTRGYLRIGVVVGHRCISAVLATMSTLVVGVKVVTPLVFFFFLEIIFLAEWHNGGTRFWSCLLWRTTQ